MGRVGTKVRSRTPRFSFRSAHGVHLESLVYIVTGFGSGRTPDAPHFFPSPNLGKQGQGVWLPGHSPELDESGMGQRKKKKEGKE